MRRKNVFLQSICSLAVRIYSHQGRKWEPKQKKKKIKRQASKKIFAFTSVFTWCEWAIKISEKFLPMCYTNQNHILWLRPLTSSKCESDSGDKRVPSIVNGAIRTEGDKYQKKINVFSLSLSSGVNDPLGSERSKYLCDHITIQCDLSNELIGLCSND